MAAHERQRQRRVSLVQRRRQRALIVRPVGRLHRRMVQAGTRERPGITRDRLAAARGKRCPGNVLGRLARMLRPLRQAGLARDHGDRVRGGRPGNRHVEIVEHREIAGILPKKRNRVAVEVAHHQLGLLLLRQRAVRQRGQWRARGTGDDLAVDRGQALLVQRIAIVQRIGAIVIDAVHDAGMRMIDAVRIGRIQRHGRALRVHHAVRDLERRNRADRIIGIDDRLAVAELRADGEQPIGAREGSEMLVE